MQVHYLFLYFCIFVCGESATEAPFSILKFVSENGYPIESHRVVTEDGYLLMLHRIPYGRLDVNRIAKRPVVFLMHGLFLSSDCYVIGGRNESLAFLLADKGYDVWMGNARGNAYSKKHISLDSRKDREFWNFSWHEIGYYDLPASISYVLNTTQSSQLFFVGYSQGGSSFFVMASERPEMNKFIRLMVGIAPAVFVGNRNDEINQTTTSAFRKTFENVRNTLPLYEIGPDSEGIAHYLMSIVRSLIEMAHIDNAKLKYYLDILPSSISSRQVSHYIQVFLSGKFERYDFGPEVNVLKYGTAAPPAYNLSKVSAPVALYFGAGDFLVTPGNGNKLSKLLPNVISSKVVPFQDFNHLDFVIAKDAGRVLYNDIVSLLARSLIMY